MGILSKVKELVKVHEVDILLGIGVTLISLLSFAVGYLTAKEQLKELIHIEKSQTLNPNDQS